jgi:hypothetical protein
MPSDQSAQSIIAPLATLLTTFLWLETWLEILSRGAYRSPDDLSKLYLSVMAAYAGAAEISKWLVNAPTDSTQDPRFERIHRGGFFVWLWLAPLLLAYGWRITNPAIPMPAPLEKITIGLVGIFFLKAASRKLRHKQHGVIDPVTGAIKEEDEDSDNDGIQDSQESDFTEVLYKRIADSPNGMSVVEILSAFPNINKPRLYRAFDQLIKANRLTRTGKPRTADVRYRAVNKG